MSGDCTVYANGLGGSTATATTTTPANSSGYYGDGRANQALSDVPYCPAPQYILLASNLVAGNGPQNAAIEFGYTQVLESGQGSSASIPFRIVAEQAGVSPYDPNTTNTAAH